MPSTTMPSTSRASCSRRTPRRIPIERYRRWLKEQAVLDEVRDDEIGVEVKRLLNDAMKRAEDSPMPERSELLTGVYAEPDELDTPHHR